MTSAWQVTLGYTVLIAHVLNSAAFIYMDRKLVIEDNIHSGNS